MEQENLTQFKIAILGHVDHGKSTLIGRLLADSGALPEGKLEQVQNYCRNKARPFEYAFLLDALKEEQAQGITIETARCFFKTKKRRYMLIDVPGHTDFLRNMVTGLSRADAIFLIIDASEGIKENSKRHGYVASMLGLNQVAVLINKMDKVAYSKTVYDAIKQEFSSFLDMLNISVLNFIPVSAFFGENLVSKSNQMGWYDGPTVLQQIDDFEYTDDKRSLPLRFPVQDIYKFTEHGDERRIIVGTIETGKISVGDKIIVQPGNKTSTVTSIEGFNTDKKYSAFAEEATGIMIADPLYIKRGDMISKADETLPAVTNRFRANICWLGSAPMLPNRKYKIKIGAHRGNIKLVEILHCIDATSSGSFIKKNQVDRNDIAECVFETPKPVAFDVFKHNKFASRFVIISDYRISGAGVILEALKEGDSILEQHVIQREVVWRKGSISPKERSLTYKHNPKFILITGKDIQKVENVANDFERKLFSSGLKTYLLHYFNLMEGLNADIKLDSYDVHIERLGELARIMTDAGLIFIVTLPYLDKYDLHVLETLNKPSEIIVVTLGESELENKTNTFIINIEDSSNTIVEKLLNILKVKEVLMEYNI